MKKYFNLKNYFIILAIFIFTLLFIGLPLLYSNSNKHNVKVKKSDELLIAHTEIFGKLERSGVIFNHSLHSEKYKKEGCKTCHHFNQDGNYKFEILFDINKKKAKEITELYHKKCIGCHEKEIKKVKKVLPVRCGECHKKNIHLINYPLVKFDFLIHEKHSKALNHKCIFCHHSYDKEEKELVYEEGTEQSCYYCHDLQIKHSHLLESDISVTTQKSLNMKKVSHYLCVNCHLEVSQKNEKAGPVECSKCHTGEYRTIAELKDIPRMRRDQPVVSLISIEESQMKGVSFDHSFHEKNTLTCRECHHQTLKSCKECHALKGSREGRWINTASAYHDILSSYSCIGCHDKQKNQKECNGCHYYIKKIDLTGKGPKKESCNVCHTGKKEIKKIKSLPIAELDSMKIPENVTVKILEKEYEASVFPHLKIIKKLTEISNKSEIATYFHRDIQTICKGCHHQSITEIEAKANKPPFCRSCHSINFDPKNMNRPRLFAIYHRQCMGCHEKMQIKAIGCRDCHKEKKSSMDISKNKNNNSLF
jgi:hypothetical protein